MLLITYRFILFLAVPFLWALLRIRAARGLEESSHIQERCGQADTPRPPGKLVWVHAASVGEMKSILPLVRHLLNKNDDLTCLITTVTVTAARLARRADHPRIIHQYAPLDRQKWMNRFLDHWQPSAAIWVESEFWPNMLSTVKARGIPLMLVNGRLSERSAARWGMAPKTIAHILGLFDLALAQSADDGARLRKLGARDIAIAGNMKYSGSPLLHDATALEHLRAQTGNRPVFLFASTHEGEEALAGRVYGSLKNKYPDLLGIVMPRHPSRGDSIAGQLDKDGVHVARRSLKQSIDASTQIYIADTLGEPGLFYRLCPIVYVGNSLFKQPGGGHNPIEPAQLNCAIIYGPNMWNFSEVSRHLTDVGGALMVRDERNLVAAVDSLLSDPAKAAKMAAAALDFVAAQNGVLDKVAGHLRPALSRAQIAA